MKSRLRCYLVVMFLALCFAGLTATAVQAAVSAKGQASNDENWNALISAAKKEGRVSIYSTWIPETRIALSKAFNEKYGIEASWLI